MWAYFKSSLTEKMYSSQFVSGFDRLFDQVSLISVADVIRNSFQSKETADGNAGQIQEFVQDNQDKKMGKETETYYPKNRQEWRRWLQNNHDKKQSVWLIYYKKKSNIPTITYSEAVDEALCFGCIDSKTKSLDDVKFMQFFSKRKPNSVWSKVNKERIERLTNDGLMTKAGFEIIETAKKNGAWKVLDEMEALVIPKDLDAELDKRTGAKSYFLGLSRSDRRNILQWLRLAKRQETRQKRITEIAELAEQNLKPKQFRG